MADNLPPSSADVTESGSLNLPETSGPHRPVMGLLYLFFPFFTIPSDWKRAIVVAIDKGGGNRSVVTKSRPVSLTSVACKYMEHVIAGHLRQVWVTSKWLYGVQHGFRPRYSFESQIVTVC
jgi:hypothetical protein